MELNRFDDFCPVGPVASLFLPSVSFYFSHLVLAEAKLMTKRSRMSLFTTRLHLGPVHCVANPESIVRTLLHQFELERNGGAS